MMVLMRMQILSPPNKKKKKKICLIINTLYPNYLRGIFLWAGCTIENRSTSVVFVRSRRTVFISLSRHSQMRSLAFIVFACSVVCVCVCCFLVPIRLFWQPSDCQCSNLPVQTPPLPPRSLQPKNILSRLEMSEPIAMETVLKSLERRPPLWLYPIRF